MVVNVDMDNNEVTIRLNKNFYDIESIKKSVEDFSSLCSAKVNDGDYIDIILKSKGNSDINLLGYEFSNYVLALMKSNNAI